MNVVASPRVSSERGKPVTAVPPVVHAPLKHVRILLPIWGYKYVRRFLEVALPTWLAPGNIPALAATADCEMVIMTTIEDEEFLFTHSAFQRLRQTCRVTIQYIDHIVTGDNYSTTITLAYTQAVRSMGEAATDTCFFFLVSDYIVSDGSFGNVLKRVEGGASGVLAGNFQVAEEDAEPWLQERVLRSPHVLSLPARELVRWGLTHLHPNTIANTVNYPFAHNAHTNRLFWRVDGSTLIGCFYLMHMIAIRPERTDFVIGAACDYSFIPEMVPSNNVVIITDSDEYLTVEAQPRDHEHVFLKPRKQTAAALAAGLSEWATARHRQNAKTPVVFHAEDIPQARSAIQAEATKFVNSVEAHMPKKARPHRLHPYWLGAIAAMHDSTGVRLTDSERRLALGLSTGELVDSRWERLLNLAIKIAIGSPPNVRPWHARRLDYELVLSQLRRSAPTEKSRLLLVSTGPTPFTTALMDGGETVMRFKMQVLLKLTPEMLVPLNGTIACCLVEIGEGDFHDIGRLLDRLTPIMQSGGHILVSCYNRRDAFEGTEFVRSIAYHASRLVRPGVSIVDNRYVPSSRLRWRIHRALGALGRRAKHSPIIGLPLLAVIGPFLLVGSLFSNLFARPTSQALAHKLISSFLVVLEARPDLARQTHEFSAEHVQRRRERLKRGLTPVLQLPPGANPGTPPDTKAILGSPAKPGRPTSLVIQKVPAVSTTVNPAPFPADADESTRETQYNRCLELKSQFGLTSLGLMTNQVWHDDPRRLTFLLARYKFVSKMLSGKKMVGELGCGDAFGTRIVQQEVERVVAYDFDPVFIKDIKERQSATWPVEAHFHDILEQPLPNKHDGIYSLDVIEHIMPADEDTYVRNLASSLTDDGVLIVGSPSLESQSYASPPSKAGHVNCKSGEQLRVLMKQHFRNVFLFSMNDEVVHTGYSPMAHYLFAICVQKK